MLAIAFSARRYAVCTLARLATLFALRAARLTPRFAVFMPEGLYANMPVGLYVPRRYGSQRS
jgi:hypothetical protein